MRIASLILILFFGISCTRENVQDQPEGELLDKIVSRNMSSTSYKYFTKTYTYEQKRLIKIVADVDGQVNSELKFNYDVNGRLVKTEKINSSSTVSWTYEYDNQNRIIKINTPPAAGIYNALYDYDLSGNVIKYSALNNVTNQLVFYMVYEHDSKGNRITREAFANNNGTIEYYGKFSFTYDQMKNPYNREELRIPTCYESAYFTGGIPSEHNFLYESIVGSGQVASAKVSLVYQKNGLPKAQWYTFVTNPDTTYYYYK